jgi:hypothetical protein
MAFTALNTAVCTSASARASRGGSNGAAALVRSAIRFH